jgi:hypothetical protein
MKSTRNEYGALAVVICGLVAAVFVIGQHQQPPTASQRAAAKVSYLNQIASIHLLPGMTQDEVADCLALHGLRPLSLGHLSVSMTIFYGREGLYDPVIAVEFQRKAKRDYFVTEWRVEK